MRRREFIAAGGVSLIAHAPTVMGQQKERTRRVALLTPLAEHDADSQRRIKAFKDGLQKHGWMESRNLLFDFRWGSGDGRNVSRSAHELAAQAPDVVLAHGSPAVQALRQAGCKSPIVFVSVIDPVGAGFVDGLARPGANITGFTLFEYSLSSKWLELLKDLVPDVKRVAVLRDAAISAGAGQLGAMQAAAPAFGVELRPLDLNGGSAIERGFVTFAPRHNDGLVVTGSTLATVHRELIVALAAKYRLPAVYVFRQFATAGGLMSYGPDNVSPYKSAADYTHRILTGEHPSELPVQAPTRYELVINLKTAKVLGIEVPPMLLARANEVIE